MAVPSSEHRSRALLDRADRLLMEAAGERNPRERFRTAYLAALRGAATVLAATTASKGTRERTRNAWVLMARSAPEFVMWADYFADHSATRAALEAGITREVTDAAADEFFGRVGAFLHDVEDLISDAKRLPAAPGWGAGMSA